MKEPPLSTLERLRLIGKLLNKVATLLNGESKDKPIENE